METKKITVEEVFVTPAIAEEYLKKNTKNRNLSTKRVIYYSKVIIDGDWKRGVDSIDFDVDGTLINGQTRLHAIIKAGIGVYLIVKRNIPKDSFFAMDLGKKRTSGDIFKINGVCDSTNMAAGVKIVKNSTLKYQTCINSRGSNKLFDSSEESLYEFYEQNLERCEITLSKARILYNNQVDRIFSVSHLFAYIWELKNRGWSYETIEDYFCCISFQNTSGLNALTKIYKILQSNRTNKIHLTPLTAFKIVAYGFNLYIKKKDVSIIPYSSIKDDIDFVYNKE